MSTAEWVASGLSALEVLAWPLVVLAVVLMLRKRLPLIERGIAHILTRRGFEAKTPFGSLKVEPPATETLLAADAAALESTEKELPEGPEKEALRAQLETLRQATRQLTEVWSSDLARTSDARAHRIAERARTLLRTDDAHFAKGGMVEFLQMEAYGPDDVDVVQYYGGFSGPGGSLALLYLAHSAAWSEGLEDATYLDYVAAAELLRREGVAVNVPPFDDIDLYNARRANAIQWR